MSIPAANEAGANEFSKPQLGVYRWVICGLLFFATTVNYLDRQVISFLKEFFCASPAHGGFGWSNTDFANLTAAFTGFYAGMTIIAGWVIDRIGTKIGLALALTVWSTFGILNAFVGPLVLMHMLVRSAFAIGEAGNFPASIKTVAEWFPKRERALATGIFNSGSNFGAMTAALLVPWCMIHFGDEFGWKMAFMLTGAIGYLWLILWFWFYDTPARQKRLSKSEFDYIHIDEQASADKATGPSNRVSWGSLFRYRQTWSFFCSKFLTDGVWWFYLFWLPDYLKKQFGMNQHDVMLPTFIVYGVAVLGSVYGGSLPMTLVKRGMQVPQARMTSMFVIALLPLTVLTTQYFGNVHQFGKMAAVLAVAVICLGAAAHQAWSANLFSTVSDMFPKTVVGSVTGIGTMAGGIGGMTMQKIAGALTDHYQATPQTAYLIMFVICGLSYVTAWNVMKLLVPRFEPVNLDQ